MPSNGRSSDSALVRDGLDAAALSLQLHELLAIHNYSEEWPLEPALHAFEVLAGDVVRTGPRCTASFTDFVDPIHR